MERKKAISGIIPIVIIIFSVSSIILSVYHHKEIYPFGGNSISYGDMSQQTIPENLYYMWDVLHGKASPFFTWNSGFGLNISGAASEQAFFSPLNLFILFSSRDHLTDFVNILFIIKIAAIAIAMYLYLKKYKIKEPIKIGASVLYAFGAASLIHYHIMFVMDMAFLLPILMIGYDQIFCKKKCGLFIAVCSLCLVENIYMSFMVLLFILIVSGLHFIGWQKSREEKGEYAFLLGMSVLISLMISAVVVLPALNSILKSSRVGKSFIGTYAEAISSSWTTRDWEVAKYLLINLSFPAAAGIYGFLSKKAGVKFEKRRMILILLLLIPFAVNGTELLWHGGSRNWWPIRFIFLLSFAVVDYLVRFLQKTDFCEEKKTELWCIPAFLGGLLCSGMAGRIFVKMPDFHAHKEVICIVLCCFFAFGYYAILAAEKKRVSLAVFLIVLEVTTMTGLFLAPDTYQNNEHDVAYLTDIHGINDSMGETAPFERIKDSEGRIKNVNYSLVMGRESLANYIHVIDASYQPLLSKWGYSSHWTRLLDTGGTIFTDTLFGIRYIISGTKPPEAFFEYVAECQGTKGNIYYISENRYALPLISYLEDNGYELSDNLFENQNVIFRSVTGYSGNLIEEYSDIRIGESTIVEAEGKKALYLYGNDKQSFSIRVNGEDLVIPAKSNDYNYNYPIDFNNGLLFLGYFEDQTVFVDFFNLSNTDGIHLGMLDVEVFEAGMNSINSELMEKIAYERTHTSLRITLDSSREGTVFIPVLYDEGWSCKVNGDKETVGNAFGFLKVHVRQGTNEIHLKFTPKGMIQGGFLTAAGIVIGAVFLFVYCKKAHGKYIGRLYQASYGAFLLVFGGVMILFYLIPILKYLEGLLIRV